MLKWTSGGSLDTAECSQGSDTINIRDVSSSTFHTVDQRASLSLSKTSNIMESNLSSRDDCTPKQDKTDSRHIRRIERDVNLIERDRSSPPSPQDFELKEGQDANMNLRKSGLFTKFKNIFKRSSSKGPGTKSAPNSPTAFGSIHRIDGNKTEDLVDGQTPSSSLKGRKSRLERLIDANRDNRRHKERLHETQTKVNKPLSEFCGNEKSRSNFVSQANNKQPSPWHNDISNINTFHNKRELMRDHQVERHKTLTSRHTAQFKKQSAILENRAQDIRENKRKRFTANSTSTKSDTCILPSMLEGIVSKASYSKVSTSLNHKNCNRFYETTDNKTDVSPLKTDNALLRSGLLGRSPKPDSIYFRQWLEKVKQIDPFTLHTAKRSLNKFNASDRRFTWSCSKDGRLVVFPSPEQKRSKNILPQKDRSSGDKVMPRNNNNGHGSLQGCKEIDILTVGSLQSLQSSTIDKFNEQTPTRTSYPKDKISLRRSLAQKVNHNQDTDDSSRVRRIVHSLEEKMSSGTFHSPPTILPANISSKPPKSPSKKDKAVAACKLNLKNEQPHNTKELRSPEQSISSKDDSVPCSQTSEFSNSRGFETKMSLPVNNTNDVSDVSISTAENESVQNNSEKNREINSKTFDTREQIISLTYTNKSMTQLNTESSSSMAILSETQNHNSDATSVSFESFLSVELHRNEPLAADEPSLLSSESFCESPVHLLEIFTEKSESPVLSHGKNNDSEMVLQRNELILSTSDLQNEDPSHNITAQSSTVIHSILNDLNQESKVKDNITTDKETIRTTAEINSILKMSTEISQNDPEEVKNFETKEQAIRDVDNAHGCLELRTYSFDEKTQGKGNNRETNIEYKAIVDLENVKKLYSGSRTSVTHTSSQTDAYSNQFGDLQSNDEKNDSGYRDQSNRTIDCRIHQTTDCQDKDNQMTDFQDNRMTDCQGNQMTDCQGNQMTDYQGNRMTDFQDNRMSDCQGNQMTDYQGNQMIDCQGNQMTNCQGNQMTDGQGNQNIDCQDYEGNQKINYQGNQKTDCQGNQRTDCQDYEGNQKINYQGNQKTDCQDNQMIDCLGIKNKDRQVNLMIDNQCTGNKKTDCHDNQIIDCIGNENTDNEGNQMTDYHRNKKTYCQDNEMTSSQGNQTIDYPGSQTITYQSGKNRDFHITDKFLKQDDAILTDSDTFVNDDIFQELQELDKHLKQTDINEQIADISAPECTLLRNCEATVDGFPNRNSSEIIDALPPSHLSTSSEDKAVIGVSFSSSDISFYKEDHFTDISLFASDSLCNMSFFSKEYDQDSCALHTPTISPVQVSTNIFKTRSESFVDNAKNEQGLEILTPCAHANLESDRNDTNVDGNDRLVLDEQGIMEIKQIIGKESCGEQEVSGTKEYTKQNVNGHKDVINEEDADFHAINNNERSICSERVKTKNSTEKTLKLTRATQSDYGLEHQFDEEEFLLQSSPEGCTSFSTINATGSDLDVQGNGHKKKCVSGSKYENLEQSSTSVRSCFTSRVNTPPSERKAYGVQTFANNVDPIGNYSLDSNGRKQTIDKDSMIYDGQGRVLPCASSDYKPIWMNVSPWISESPCTMSDKKIHFHEGSSTDDTNATPVKLYNDSNDLATYLAADYYQSCLNKSAFGGIAREKTKLTDFSASFLSDMSGDGSGDCSEPCEITKINMSEKFLQTLQQPVYTKNESPVTESSHLSLVSTKKERQFLKLRHQRQTGQKSAKKTKSMTSKSARVNFKKSIKNRDELKPFNQNFSYIGGHQLGKTSKMLSEDETKEVIDHKLNDVNDKLKNKYDQDKAIGGSTAGEYNKPKQWLFVATMLFFQLLIHWLYAR